MRRVSFALRLKECVARAVNRVTSRVRSAGRDFGPTSMIHLSRPSSSQVPPHSEQASAGMLKTARAARGVPHPEHHIVRPPIPDLDSDFGARLIYAQNLRPARLLEESPRGTRLGRRVSAGRRPPGWAPGARLTAP